MFEAGFFGTLECMFYDAAATISEWSTKSDRANVLAHDMFGEMFEYEEDGDDEDEIINLDDDNDDIVNDIVKSNKTAFDVLEKLQAGTLTKEDLLKMKDEDLEIKIDLKELMNITNPVAHASQPKSEPLAASPEKERVTFKDALMSTEIGKKLLFEVIDE